MKYPAITLLLRSAFEGEKVYIIIFATYRQTVDYVRSFANTGGSISFQIKANLQKTNS